MADHLVHVPADGIAAMAAAGVVATLLPCAAFYLKLGRFARARELIAAGVPVALATDINHGGGFSPSMPFAMTLACFAMGLTFEEALVAATINAAAALDRQDRIGSLEPGKQFDAVLVDGPAVNLLRTNASPIVSVFKKGLGMLIDRTVPSLIDAFSSADPTPGGGSAAALVGATGAALLAMVAGMLKSRTNAIAEREALDQAHTELLKVRDTLMALIDRDASAYDLVIAAFRKPKGTDEEKTERKAAIQDATRVATEVPLETIRACVTAMREGRFREETTRAPRGPAS